MENDVRCDAFASQADFLVPLGEVAEEFSGSPPSASFHDLTVLTLGELAQSHAMVVLNRVLATIAPPSAPAIKGSDGRRLVQLLTNLPGSPPAQDTQVRAEVAEVVDGLLLKAHRKSAWDVVQLVRHWSLSADSDAATEHNALWLVAELDATGNSGALAEATAAATALLEVVDRNYQRREIEMTTRRLDLAMRLLFHREFHADSLSSPLVDAPREFLAPLHASSAWQRLTEPIIRSSRAYDRRTTGRPSVLVLGGTYGRFSKPVVEALRQSVEVDELDVTARTRLSGLSGQKDLLRARVRQSLGLDPPIDYVVLEAMEGADCVFVDWADRGAMAATMCAPADVRLVLRIHSMDAFSPWIHLIDWTRVDALIFVSEHLRRVVENQLGDQLASTDVHVVPNIVDMNKFKLAKRSGCERRLAVIGWAQRVKDPLWALEVLGRLRAHDQTWRLSLIGNDFPSTSRASGRIYADRFRARVARPDVSGGIDFVPFTDSLPHVLSSVGYVISSSLRESFHVGLTEGVAAGAIPVVRNWPMFSEVGGARELFPEAWVVDDVEEAVTRILMTRGANEWRRTSEQTRAEVVRLFGAPEVIDRLRRVILGQLGS